MMLRGPQIISKDIILSPVIGLSMFRKYVNIKICIRLKIIYLKIVFFLNPVNIDL